MPSTVTIYTTPATMWSSGLTGSGSTNCCRRTDWGKGILYTMKFLLYGKGTTI